MNMNRKLVFREVRVNQPQKSEWSGYFHQWTGTSEHCLAIVETEEGYIYEVNSDYIQFIN